MSNIKDFAVGVVVTAPSPATSGTTLTLRSGDGSTMPTPPFYATATPPGQLSTVGTSEKILVTAVSADTLTFTRAQSPTTAQSIAAGWIVANAIYTADVFSSSFVLDELLTGTINGTNKVFTTASPFTAIQPIKNGVNMHLGDDFTVTGPNQITFVTAPSTGKVTGTYILGSQIMISGSNSMIFDDTPIGTKDGANTAFTAPRAFTAGSLAYYVNGIKQKRGVHFFETNPSTGAFTTSDAPLSTDDTMIDYQFVQSVSGNADTVDGIHASATPTANQLLALDGNALVPIAAMGGAWASWTPTWTNLTIGNGTTVSKYTQTGKTVKYKIFLVLGSTSSMGSIPTFTFPITAVTDTSNLIIGQAYILGTTSNNGFVHWGSTTTGLVRYYDTNNNAANITATAPFTWATGHTITISGEYEAA